MNCMRMDVSGLHMHDCTPTLEMCYVVSPAGCQSEYLILKVFVAHIHVHCDLIVSG